jgi:hypothetical protein
MSRFRTSVGLVAVAVGMSVAVGGPHVFEAAWRSLWAQVDVVVVVVLVVVTLRRVAPKGSLKLPAVVAAVGLVLLGFKHDFWSVPRAFGVGGAVLAVVGAHAVLSGVANRRDTSDAVQRVTAVLRNSELMIDRVDPVPGYLTVTGIGADARVNFEGAVWPSGLSHLEIASNCWAGRIDIVVPVSWRVVAGRIHRTWGTSFDGRLDLPEPFEYPLESLDDVTEQLDRKPSEGLVFVHVLGALGQVRVIRPSARVAPAQSPVADGPVSTTD